MKAKRIYDGSLLCHTANCCPVVEVKGDVVKVFDPAKPEDGIFQTSVSNWNKLIEAKPIVR